MAASIQVTRFTGAGPSETNITSINSRSSTSDNHYTTETTNSIPIPTAGNNRSYWLVAGLKAVSSPTGTIDTLLWYTDGANGSGTGVTVEAGTSATYVQANGTLGTTGVALNSTNYTGLTPTSPSADNAFGYTSSAALSVSGSITNPTTGNFGNYVIFQYTVGTTAGSGTSGQETYTWQYDET